MLTVDLSYEHPYDWEGLLDFFKAHYLQEIEYFSAENIYSRYVSIQESSGRIIISNNPEKSCLTLQADLSLEPVLEQLCTNLRSTFDLDTHPMLIKETLIQDAAFHRALEARPGLRVPGGLEGFEFAVRAILEQQISMKAARTLTVRLASLVGEPIQTTCPHITRLFPSVNALAKVELQSLIKLGIAPQRAQSIVLLAREVLRGNLQLEPGIYPHSARSHVARLPGIGPWTSSYIAMCALRWPDAFPKEDIVIRKKLGNVSAKTAEDLSQKWRPWRSYATIYLWQNTPYERS